MINKSNLTIFILLAVLSISIISAVWYNPFTWFEDEDIKIQTQLQIQKNSEWKILKQTGNENNFDVYFTNLKDKKTEICFVL